MLKPRYFLTALLTTSLLFFAKAQTPCSGGTAAGYPCSNVDFYSYTSASTLGASNGEGNDIWGWTDPSSGIEYALVGLNNGTAFVDISTNPSNPTLVGNLDAHNGLSTNWRDIKVVNDHAFIGADIGSHGMQIFNLSHLANANPPDVFVEDAWVAVGGGDIHNIESNDHTDFIYPVGVNNLYGGGISFYDVSNPLNPVASGGYGSNNYVHDAVCFIYRGLDTDHIGKEICVTFNPNSDKGYIIDVDDKNNPMQLSTLSYPNGNICHQGWITEDHKYILMDDEGDEPSQPNTRTFIFDITDLDNPSLKYTYVASTSCKDHDMYVKGPYVYQANYTEGLRILKIDDLDNNMPTEAGFIDIYPSVSDATYNGAWGVYPYFKSGKIVISATSPDSVAGLYIVQPNLSHYVLEVLDTGVDSVCQNEVATFTFDATAYSGFSINDNITISSVPGATITLSSNPINSAGIHTLTVSTTANTPVGNYAITLEGTQTPVNRVSVGLVVTNAIGGLPDVPLVSPSDGTIGAPVDIDFDWDPVQGATLYDIELANDVNFDPIIFSAYDLPITKHTFTGLPTATPFWWRVFGHDGACASSSPSEVWFFSTVDDPVPVELLHFGASPRENAITLEWQTASEVNSAGFELQRSTDEGRIFEKIAWIDSQQGNSIDLRTYQYTDSEVKKGVPYYYRLKQIDLDGQFEFSPVVHAQLSEKAALHIWPNPVTDQLTVQLDAPTTATTNRVEIVDITGKTVWSSTIEKEELTAGYPLTINDLEKGTYIIVVKNEFQIETRRFVKW